MKIRINTNSENRVMSIGILIMSDFNKQDNYIIDYEDMPKEHTITDYLFKNGEFIYQPDKLKKIQQEINIKISSLNNQITNLKQYLSDTDYVVIKIAEGAAAEEDYAEVISQREAARASINELESQIEELKKQLDETN